MCVYAKGSPPRWGSPDSEARENGYFGFAAANGQFNEELESLLAEIEGELWPSIKIISNPCFVWSELDRRRVVTYVALLHSRSRSRRQAAVLVSDMVHDEFARAAEDSPFVEELARKFSAKLNEAVDASYVAATMKRVAERSREPDEQARMFLGQLEHNTNVIAAVLARKPVQIWEAPGGSQFITGDTPVVTGMPVGDDFAPGFGFDRALTFFPLSPATCLVFGLNGPERRIATCNQVGHVNELVAGSMHRFAYASVMSPEIEALVNEFGGTTRFGENAFLPSGPLPDVKSFLREQG